MRLLHRLRQDLYSVEAEMLAGKGQPVLGPGAQHNLDRFVEPRGAFLWGHAEILKLDPRETAPGAPIHPPAGQHVEQCHFFGEPQRVIERRQRHPGAMRSRLVRAAAITPIMCTDGHTEKLEK